MATATTWGDGALWRWRGARIRPPSLSFFPEPGGARARVRPPSLSFSFFAPAVRRSVWRRSRPAELAPAPADLAPAARRSSPPRLGGARRSSPPWLGGTRPRGPAEVAPGSGPPPSHSSPSPAELAPASGPSLSFSFFAPAVRRRSRPADLAPVARRSSPPRPGRARAGIQPPSLSFFFPEPGGARARVRSPSLSFSFFAPAARRSSRPAELAPGGARPRGPAKLAPAPADLAPAARRSSRPAELLHRLAPTAAPCPDGSHHLRRLSSKRIFALPIAEDPEWPNDTTF
ncbi:uncharacterized protein [Miscanthus floridulus]|uniref:uncharacterized protein n=1 Tax=Miscanthus floridulus TaxID=154761 RepID=UPI00345911F3